MNYWEERLNNKTDKIKNISNFPKNERKLNLQNNDGKQKLQNNDGKQNFIKNEVKPNFPNNEKKQNSANNAKKQNSLNNEGKQNPYQKPQAEKKNIQAVKQNVQAVKQNQSEQKNVRQKPQAVNKKVQPKPQQKPENEKSLKPVNQKNQPEQKSVHQNLPTNNKKNQPESQTKTENGKKPQNNNKFKKHNSRSQATHQVQASTSQEKNHDLEKLTELKTINEKLQNLSKTLINLGNALSDSSVDNLNNSSNLNNANNSKANNSNNLRKNSNNFENNSDKRNEANSGKSNSGKSKIQNSSEFSYGNFLNTVSPRFNFMQMNDKFPLMLAFIGDAVHTLFVRSYFMQSSAGTPETQHNLSSNFCRAKSQSEALDFLDEFFSEQERDLAKRTRNVKNHSSSKNTSPEDYKKATAFEAIVGYLYLTNQIERLQDLLLKFMEKK